MKFNFNWNKNNKQTMTPELTERNVNVYKHENPIAGAEHLGERRCLECGAWFKPEHGKQVCCSKECQKKRTAKLREGYNEKAKEQYRIMKNEATKQLDSMIKEEANKAKICPICGKKFVPYNSQQVVCSNECAKVRARDYQREWYHANKAKENKSGKPVAKPIETDQRKSENRHYENAIVLCKLCESGVGTEIVAKYLETVYGDK